MISVAMTTYNGARYIKEQLDSILNQSVPVDEIVIMDDCSTDETVEIIKSYQDRRINLTVNSTNQGYIRNFYQAIMACKGDYIFLADHDDRWHFNKVEKMLGYMQENRALALCSDFKLIDADGMPLSEEGNYVRNRFFTKIKGNKDVLIPVDFDYLVLGNILQGATYCITKEVQQIYGQIKDFGVYHDHQLLLIAAKLGRLFFVNIPLIEYRIHGENTIGFAKKGDWRVLRKLKFPQLKPAMVQFLDKLHKISPLSHYLWIKVLMYLRLPSFMNIIRTIKPW